MSNFSNLFRHRKHEGRGKPSCGFRTVVVALIFALPALFMTQEAAAQQQNVTIDKQGATIQEVLQEIDHQTGLSFVFDVEDVSLDSVINIKQTNKPLTTVLDALFANKGINYVIKDNHIVLTKIKAEQASSGPFSVKGIIKDQTGMPLIGVAVVETKTGRGTTTGINGDFELKVEEGDVLHISYIGYKDQQLSMTRSQSALDITMMEDVTMVDEVVVTALGIKRKSKALGYNVQEVKGEELGVVKDVNFMNSLNGKVAGLNISSSGGVGSATKVVMRGSKSLSKDNNALYVIDGVPMINSRGLEVAGSYSSNATVESISDINPEDIESMSVLTGPAAAALYGSYAANGAILITTKKGQEGKAKVSYSHNTDLISPFVLPRFQNTYGNNPGEFGSWGSKLENPSSFDPEKFFQTGYTTTNSVSVSLGTAKNQTFASASATNAEGIMIGNDYNRYNFTVRNTSKLMNERLTLDFGGSYVIQDNRNMPGQGQNFNMLLPVYLFPRGENFDNLRLYEDYDEGRKIMTQYWPYGDQGMALQNPYWIANRNIFTRERDRYMLNAGLKFEIADWINVSGRVRVDNTVTHDEKKLYASTDGRLASNKGYYRGFKGYEKQIYGDLLVNINKSFGKFDLTANIGASIFDARYDEEGAQGQLSQLPNFFAFRNIDLNATNSGVIQNGWREQTQSIFASAELGFKSMVYLSLTARNDWASMLANTKSPSFFYPSVGLSVIFSEMFDMPEWISFLKLRSSYSSVGSAPNRFLTVPTFEWAGQGSLETNTHMPIDELFAERTKSYELGLDARFFQGRLHMDVSYYHSNTYKQTFKAKMSASSGYSSMYIQTGDVSNWGIEAMLAYKQDFGKFKWDSQLTFSMNRNKIEKLVDNYSYLDPATNEQKVLNMSEMLVMTVGDYRAYLKEGGSFGDIYTATALREDNQGNVYVNPNTGLLETVDKLQKVGNSEAKARLGFRNNFSYKGVNLGLLFSARLGGEVVSVTQAYMDRYGVSEASARARDNGGVPVNYGKLDARYFYEYVGGGETGMLSHYVYDATNVRLQELTLGYTLPRKWFNDKLSMTVSFVGRNLWMIYNKAPFDPEQTANTTGTFYQGVDYFMQPSTRNIGFSVKFQF